MRLSGVSALFLVINLFFFLLLIPWGNILNPFANTRWPLCLGVAGWGDCVVDHPHSHPAPDLECSAVISRSRISRLSLLCPAHGRPGRGNFHFEVVMFCFLLLNFPPLLSGIFLRLLAAVFVSLMCSPVSPSSSVPRPTIPQSSTS